MASYNVTINSDTIIDLPTDYANQGWSISEGTAYHDNCNPGYITNTGIPISVDVPYTVIYEVVEYTDGIVRVELGNTQGTNRSGVGIYTEELIVTENTDFRFFSDGELAIRLVTISPADPPEDNSVTIGFRENSNTWITFYSFKPEFMQKFLKDLFSFKGGAIWKHNVNEIRNNFYGEQYNSKIRFISNLEPSLNKVWFNVKIDSKGKWIFPSILTNPTDQFPLGMTSRLTPGNIKLIDGKYWADILRDMNDPHFANIPDEDQRQVIALFNGRMLQGNYLILEIENNDTEEAKLVSVAIYSSDIERNF